MSVGPAVMEPVQHMTEIVHERAGLLERRADGEACLGPETGLPGRVDAAEREEKLPVLRIDRAGGAIVRGRSCVRLVPEDGVPEDQPAVEIVVGGFQVRELDAGSLRGDESVDDLVPGLEDFVASAEVPIGPHRAAGPDDREEPSGAIQVADVDMELHAGRAVRVRDRRVGE